MAASIDKQEPAGPPFLYKRVLERNPAWPDKTVRAKRPLRPPGLLTRAELESLLARLRATRKPCTALLPHIHVDYNGCLVTERERCALRANYFTPPHRYRPLIVWHTEQNNTIRIIGAREVTPWERRTYESGE